MEEGVELVNQAGAALTEIVESIKKVANIVSEIASASSEQSTGIDQISTALAQMDEITQQNSALVEENAASVKTLEQQSQSMDEQISVFKLGNLAASPPEQPRRMAAREAQPVAAKDPARRVMRRASAAGGRGSVGNMQTALAVAFEDEAEWKEF